MRITTFFSYLIPSLRSGFRLPIAAVCIAAAFAQPPSAQVPCPSGTGGSITVTNLEDRESITHELLMVQGKLSPEAASIKVSAGEASLDWPAVGGSFKALVSLQRGGNRIVLSAPGHATRCLDVTYAPADTGNQILLVQMLGKDQPEGSGLFRAPAGVQTDLAAACKRYRFGALLAQSAVAELMHRAGRGRRTFALKRDSTGQVEVGIYHSVKTLVELKSSNNDGASDLLIKGALAAWPDKRLSKLGFMQVDSVLGTVRSDLIIRNYSSLYTWPQDMGDVVRAFTDRTRKTENGTASNPADSLPLWWHASYELGYFLMIQGWRIGAPLNNSPIDVMGQGFKKFRRLFLSGVDGKPLLQDSIAFGDTTSGNFAYSPWIRAAATTPTVIAPVAAPLSRFHLSGFFLSGGSLLLPGPIGHLRVTLVSVAGRRAEPLFSGRPETGARTLRLPPERLIPGSLLLVESPEGRTLLPILP